MSRDENRETIQTRMFDGYSVGTGEITGGPADGMESVGITFRNHTVRKRLSVSMPMEMAIQLAKDILHLSEDEDNEDEDD